MKPICVVKIGGALVDSTESLPVLVSRIRSISKDWSVVIVHGGGPQATRLARRLGREPVIVEGRRVTSLADLDVILATVCGTVNTQLVGEFCGVDVPAVGTNGAAGAMVKVTRRPPWHLNGDTIDFGYVGDIQEVDPSLLLTLLDAGFVPVVASVGIDASGQLYNVNADTTASAIAASLQAKHFSIVTDSGGLKKGGRTVHYCDEELHRLGQAERWITDGMLVKLKAGFAALRDGVGKVEVVGPGNLLGNGGTELVHAAVEVTS